MATTAGLPVYMLPGVPIRQPTHLEGDSSLATEILPGPPSLLSAQQSAQKRDPRKPSIAYSYLPPKDPGSTYSGIMHGTLVGQELDGPPTKRSRIDRRCVLSYFLMHTITCSLFYCLSAGLCFRCVGSQVVLNVLLLVDSSLTSNPSPKASSSQHLRPQPWQKSTHLSRSLTTNGVYLEQSLLTSHWTCLLLRP